MTGGRTGLNPAGRGGGRSCRALLALLPVAFLLVGCEVRSGRPDALWLLWLGPGLLLFYIYAFRTRSRLLGRFASPEMLPALVAGVSRPRRRLKAVLVLVAVLALVASLSQPRWGFVWEEVHREGVDIVVALDVSDSMLVRDAEAGGELSRLERAKREIADLLGRLEGDRIALVAFAGAAFLELPLTLDYSAAALFLEAMDPDLIPTKGTAIGEALRVSLEAFERVASVGSRQSRAVILITDGEDHLGEAQEVAETAAAAGVRVFAIGIGRDEGAPIPREGGGFRTDRRGEIILSRLDEAALQRIALTTGGRYVRSVTGDVDLEQIYAQGIKAQLEDQELGSSRRQRWQERFQWLLVIALAALMLEPLISDRLRRRRVTVASAVCLAWLLSLPDGALAQPQATESFPAAAETSPAVEYSSPYEAFDAGAYAQALEGFVDRQTRQPDDPEVSLNVGAAHYKLNDFDSADAQFFRAAATGDDALRAEALYNLGNSAYRQDRLGEAIDLYMASLEVNPDDLDTKFNLEFVREELKKRQQQQQDQDQNEQNQDQEEQSQEGAEQQSEDPSQDGGEQPEDQQQDRGGQDPSRDPESEDGQDPEDSDRDDDGVPDAADSPPEGEGPDQGGQDGPREPPQGMTPEEAERYLQALEEGRLDPRRRGQRGRPSRQAKDW
ncbi:MAG: VWA domain-containing protein [Acidobacteria bacterium]|nr:VWA domain-containing protein [Acidobacteriota bacterium]